MNSYGTRPNPYDHYCDIEECCYATISVYLISREEKHNTLGKIGTYWRFKLYLRWLTIIPYLQLQYISELQSYLLLIHCFQSYPLWFGYKDYFSVCLVNSHSFLERSVLNFSDGATIYLQLVKPYWYLPQFNLNLHYMYIQST